MDSVHYNQDVRVAAFFLEFLQEKSVLLQVIRKVQLPLAARDWPQALALGSLLSYAKPERAGWLPFMLASYSRFTLGLKSGDSLWFLRIHVIGLESSG